MSRTWMGGTTVTGDHLVTRPTPDGGLLVSTVVQWQHSRGAAAHALGRLYVPAGCHSRPVAVLSELRGNPDWLGVGADFAPAAEALLEAARAAAVVYPRTVTWVAHYGEFSYHDPFGGESFTVIDLRWDGQRYHDVLDDHRLLKPDEAAALFDRMPLEPVPQVLAELDWPF